MHTISSIGLGLVALAGLAACGKSDDAIRTEARTRLTANCPRSATPDVTAMLAQEGVTIAQVCTCSIDRYLRSATVAQITEDSAVATPPRVSAASTQCMTELVTAAQANRTAQSNGAAPPSDGAPVAHEAGRRRSRPSRPMETPRTRRTRGVSLRGGQPGGGQSVLALRRSALQFVPPHRVAELVVGQARAPSPPRAGSSGSVRARR